MTNAEGGERAPRRRFPRDRYISTLATLRHELLNWAQIYELDGVKNRFDYCKAVSEYLRVAIDELMQVKV